MRLLSTAILAVLPMAAGAEPVIVPSTGTVPETVGRLRTAVDEAGGQVFGVIDFGSVVRTIGEDIGELQLVLFGDPRIGAAALSADPMAALDLPGKILVYGTAEGSRMAYEVPAEMLAEWNIPADAPVLQIMSQTLASISSTASR